MVAEQLVNDANNLDPSLDYYEDESGYCFEDSFEPCDDTEQTV